MKLVKDLRNDARHHKSKHTVKRNRDIEREAEGEEGHLSSGSWQRLLAETWRFGLLVVVVVAAWGESWCIWVGSSQSISCLDPAQDTFKPKIKSPLIKASFSPYIKPRLAQSENSIKPMPFLKTKFEPSLKQFKAQFDWSLGSNPL